MSFEAVLWATNDAPIGNVNEFAVLVMLAERADPDGCSAFPSRPTMAARTHIDPKTVLRTLQRLEERRLIGKGDQRAAAYIRADRRPVVYDLLIPYRWFPNVDRINKEREDKGKPPLTAQDRPAIADPPEKARRSDRGKKRPRSATEERGDSESPRSDEGDDAHGVTLSPPRGDSQSRTGGLRVTQTSSMNQSTEPDHNAPSARSANDGRRPPTGSRGGRGGGSAASGKTNPGEEEVRAADIGRVVAALPQVIRDALPTFTPAAMTEPLEAELRRGITTTQLVARINRRWNLYGYSLDADTEYGGRGIDSPTGVAAALVRRGQCLDARCDDGTNIDSSLPCRSCERDVEDRRAARRRDHPDQPDDHPSPAKETYTAPAFVPTQTRTPAAPQDTLAGPVVPIDQALVEARVALQSTREAKRYPATR